jgi:hypothetical protein
MIQLLKLPLMSTLAYINDFNVWDSRHNAIR